MVNSMRKSTYTNSIKYWGLYLSFGMSISLSVFVITEIIQGKEFLSVIALSVSKKRIGIKFKKEELENRWIYILMLLFKELFIAIIIVIQLRSKQYL